MSRDKKENSEKKENKENKRRYKKGGKTASEAERDYEFMHYIEDSGNTEAVPRDVISSKTKTVVVILLLCLVSVIIATGWNYLAPDKIIENIQTGLSNNGGESYPTFISGTKISDANFQYANNYLTYISDTSLVCLNKSAAKIVDRPISFSQPAMKIAGDNILTYSINGVGYQIDKASDTRIKNELENPIIQGDVSSNGNYAFLTDTDGYLSKLVAFDSSDRQIFSYSFADYYATSVALNNGGNLAAVSTVTTENGNFKTVIYVLDFSKEEPVAMLEEANTLVYSCEFMDNGAIAVICDNQALMIKSNYTDIDRYDYEGLSLTAFSYDESSGAVISLSPSSDGGNCHIAYLNKNGSLDKIVDTEYRISSIDIYGGKIAALCDGFTAFYKTSGEEAGTADSGLDAQSITMHSENSVYVLGMTEIRDVTV